MENHYTYYTKCTVISRKHVVFDFKIFRSYYLTRRKPFSPSVEGIVGEGNIIIDDSLSGNYRTYCVVNTATPNDPSLEKAFNDAINDCFERAKFIFGEKEETDL